ncbi:MAG: sigma-70 family RNA polymerase sigma factor, partial [Chloroflexi bacterium]
MVEGGSHPVAERPADHANRREASDVTSLLHSWQAGKEAALEKLIPIVYAELHRIAQRLLRGERQGHTLQPSALVNETYFKLVKSPVPNFEDRVHFFAVSARVMRQILVDHARRRGAQKRRGGDALSRIETDVFTTSRTVDVIAVDRALEKLAALDTQQAQLVELRFFAGLTVEEAAAALNISVATIHRKWVVARA